MRESEDGRDVDVTTETARSLALTLPDRPLPVAPALHFVTMDTVWFEALHEYIQSDEWYQTIGVFIDSHCQLFSQETLKTSSAASNNGANTVAAFDHGQYHVYKEFVDISENILNNMLDSLGGSLDLLGQALDEHASLPPNGPRDNQRNEMINLLLTFDSFPHFTQMMSSKSFKQDYYDANPHHVRVTPQATSFDPNDLNNLTSMGFPTDACVNALTKCGGDFDEALQYLFDNPPSSPRGGGSKEAAPSAPPHPLETQVADLRSTRPNTLHRSASLSNISSATFVTQCEFAQVSATSRPLSAKAVERDEPAIERDEPTVERDPSARRAVSSIVPRAHPLLHLGPLPFPLTRNSKLTRFALPLPNPLLVGLRPPLFLALDPFSTLASSLNSMSPCSHRLPLWFAPCLWLTPLRSRAGNNRQPQPRDEPPRPLGRANPRAPVLHALHRLLQSRARAPEGVGHDHEDAQVVRAREEPQRH